MKYVNPSLQDVPSREPLYPAGIEDQRDDKKFLVEPDVLAQTVLI